jgi:two-component sensor histidine kinase
LSGDADPSDLAERYRALAAAKARQDAIIYLYDSLKDANGIDELVGRVFPSLMDLYGAACVRVFARAEDSWRCWTDARDEGSFRSPLDGLEGVPSARKAAEKALETGSISFEASENGDVGFLRLENTGDVRPVDVAYPVVRAGKAFALVVLEGVLLLDKQLLLELEGACRFLAFALRAELEGYDELHASYRKLESALAQKDVMLRELNHRVKNNLQLVSSLIRLEMETSGAEARAKLETLNSRLHSIALTHERLYASGDLSRIDAAEYLETLCRDLQMAYASIGIDLSVDASEGISLDVAMAIPLGIIVNELATNAFKYAFPQGVGALRVSLRRDGPYAEVRVVDDGVGFGAHSPSKGIGLEVAHALARQLDGSLSIADASPGTAATLRFPLRLASASFGN